MGETTTCDWWEECDLGRSHDVHLEDLVHRIVMLPAHYRAVVAATVDVLTAYVDACEAGDDNGFLDTAERCVTAMVSWSVSNGATGR